MSRNRIRLNICGAEFALTSDDSESYIHAIAEEVEAGITEMVEKNPHISITTAGIISALNYCDAQHKAEDAADNLRSQIKDYLEDSPYILRPANFAANLPGRGFGVYEGPQGLRLGVVNLMGRFELDANLDSPFHTADRILAELEADLVFVDFHAEATSGKGARGWSLDGRVQAVWGTHTQVPTADTQILPQGTGFVTDLGMTGPALSILGVKPENSIARFLGQLPRRYEAAQGPNRLGAVLFTIDTQSKGCCQVTRVDVTD